ncbi:MAG TPA: hypothetical protein VEQ66_08485 [Propionibacteriaceae bacterium]|nr:hypothetical protein [Propionibacteriaceae bacterium]
MDHLSTLGRAVGARGEVVLRRRLNQTGTVDELIVNGAFAMDSTETTSERELARLALHRGRPDARLLVGGLGLGYTAYEALRLPVGHIDVVELEPALVEWAHAGLTPTLGLLAQDPRVTLVVGDIATVLLNESIAGSHSGWDAIVLDVDNGPDFLVHTENASLYGHRLLATAYGRLAAGGRLAIWCQGPSPALTSALQAVAPTVQEKLVPVTRGTRRLCYAIYTLDRLGTGYQR